MKHVARGGRMKWAHAIAKKWVAGVFAVAVLAVTGLILLHPQPAQAALGTSAKWINRFYIQDNNGAYYFDHNTFDNDLKYIKESTEQCKDVIEIYRVNGIRPFNRSDDAWFYGSNLSFFGTKIIDVEPVGTSTGGTGCSSVAEHPINIDSNNNAKRITWYKTPEGNLVNILSGVKFSRKTDYKNVPRYFRDSEVADTANSCPDMILEHAANPLEEGEGLFGRGDVAGSAMLYPVEKNDDLDIVSESYDINSEPNLIDNGTCHLRGEAVNKRYNGEFSIFFGEPHELGLFLVAGLDENGSTRPSGDYEDDAIIIFIGGADNMKKDATGAPVTAPTDPGSSNPDLIDQQVCKGGALGWLICPIVSAIQTGMDLLRDLLQLFLTVNPLPIGSGQIYESWDNVRNFANIMFVIGFFAIIFSQATSIGISNYGIKRLLPRLIIVVIATNVSYFICSFAIDVFNILGVGITSLMGVINGGSAGTIGTGGTGAEAAMIAAITALIIWAFSTGAIVEVFPLVVAGALGLLLMFFVLILRQCIIILLVVFSPLAFVAGLLPGTERFLSRWTSLFIGMLVMYPITMAIFAGARIVTAILSSV